MESNIFKNHKATERDENLASLAQKRIAIKNKCYRNEITLNQSDKPVDFFFNNLKKNGLGETK